MPKPQQEKHAIVFIDYEPAEVKETSGSNWRIVFRCRIPGTSKMKRFRRRVKPMDDRRMRMKYARRICVEINKKLERGWSPFVDQYSSKEYRLLSEALSEYKRNCEIQAERGQLRPDTTRSYLSQIKQLQQYCKLTNQEEVFSINFNRGFVRHYLDYIYYDKKRSPRTVNNYLHFCSQFANFLVEREYLSANSIKNIGPMQNQRKKREIIDVETRSLIIRDLKQENRHFLTCCLVVFYCFIRRTELTKLKVGHVDLKAAVIRVPKEISKNKKDDTVTIPNALMPYLIDHLNGSTNQDFLFSTHFKTGKKQLAPKYISDAWAKLRDRLEFKSEYQFYSLKDTGITQLFLLNVPLLKIRDQARHYDIKITESYTPRNYKKDDFIFSIENTF